jgi:hypothetical protein
MFAGLQCRFVVSGLWQWIVAVDCGFAVSLLLNFGIMALMWIAVSNVSPQSMADVKACNSQVCSPPDIV